MWLRIFALLVCLMTPPLGALAQEPRFTINLRGSDIALLTEQISEITGRTLIVHPDLRGEIVLARERQHQGNESRLQ